MEELYLLDQRQRYEMTSYFDHGFIWNEMPYRGVAVKMCRPLALKNFLKYSLITQLTL